MSASEEPETRASEEPATSDLISIGEPGGGHEIGVYGAPRPAVPERVALAPRTKGCASGAGSLGSVEPGEFRRLPPWLKIQLPGSGDYAETKSLYDESLRIRRRALGDRHPKVGRALMNLSDLEGRLGNFEESYRLAAAAAGLIGKGGEEHLVGVALSNQGAAALGLGRLDEAAALLRRAREIEEKALGPSHPFVAETLEHQARLALRQGRAGEAEALFRRALVTYLETHPEKARCLAGLGEAARAHGRLDEAEARYREALAHAERTLGAAHPETAALLAGQARLLREAGRLDEARRAAQTAVAHLPAGHPDAIAAREIVSA